MIVKLATFLIAALAGGALGGVGVAATLGAVSPSADHVASETDANPAEAIYGAR
ncbi:hypothetical protein ACTI_40880 [Actinoplanes sp. OR16]|uniref:hypothetical protein n=1 Tax=Actinoplanes sp. OR16 TaxID=946334 RepID=UPI000F6F90E7|nr:hypothetical protein [Actinoplanes sp. OR16]BBH67403.1 hypothetical protein ACTI_40880 [Actinoplanes sp. OR16]